MAFIECVLIKRVSAWALELVLCREHLIGSAAIIAKSKYNGQKSVGDGCKHVIALWKISSVTRGANLHFTWSNFNMDKWRSWPTINTGWDRGSVVLNALLMLITVLLISSSSIVPRNTIFLSQLRATFTTGLLCTCTANEIRINQ